MSPGADGSGRTAIPAIHTTILLFSKGVDKWGFDPFGVTYNQQVNIVAK